MKTRQVYFIYPFPCWLKRGKSFQTCLFFHLKLTYLAQKICILESVFFARQELIKCLRLRIQDFVTGENFSFNHLCHNKEFFSVKLIYKSNRKLFSCICIAWYKHSRDWKNSRQLCKPSTPSRVCITVENSPNPSRVYIRLCKHGKRFLLLSIMIVNSFLFKPILPQQ